MTIYADHKMSSLEDPVLKSNLRAKLVACHLILSQVVAVGLLISHCSRNKKQEKLPRENPRLRQTQLNTPLPRVGNANPDLN